MQSMGPAGYWGSILGEMYHAGRSLPGLALLDKGDEPHQDPTRETTAGGCRDQSVAGEACATTLMHADGLIQAVYAATLNRKHTALNLSSTAVRTCIILGMHLEMSELQLQNIALREHRRRLW